MPENVFGDALAAGAILTGFCGTFLVFKIQREADYHRRPEEDTDSASLSHFSASLLILLLACLLTTIFGTAFPLLGLSGIGKTWITMQLIAAGLLGSLVLISGYFAVELVHYEISLNKLSSDKTEWKREGPIILVAVLIAIVLFLAIYVFV